jgi:hypothetical protein
MYEKYTNLRSKLQMYKLAERDAEFGRQTQHWLWLLVGPVRGEAGRPPLSFLGPVC